MPDQGSCPLPSPRHDEREHLTVLVCRGCCCGTDRKHPDVDHDTQLELLRQAAETAGARLRVTDCLGPCERSNVVVLRSRGIASSTTVWLGDVLDVAQTSALAERLVGWMGAPQSLTRIAGDLAFTPVDETKHCEALSAQDDERS